MTEAAAAAATNAATETTEAAAAPETADSAKEKIYIAIGDFVKEKTGKRIGKTGGREIFDLVTEQMFATAAAEGTIRFNGGFGSYHIKEYSEGERRLPSGATTKFGKRKKLRYEEGVVVKALVANGGNLEEALKVRGSRAKPEAEAPAAKPAKADKKAAKATTAAPAATVTPAAAAKPATDESVDLD